MIYDVLIRMIEGERLPAVKDRTRAQRSAVVRYWRAHGDLSVKEEGSCKFYLLLSYRVSDTKSFRSAKGYFR